jgi:hypothetical protein
MFVKIFPQMYEGTLAARGPWEALVTFQNLLVLADPVGIVDMTHEAISRRTTIPLEIIRTGIEALEQPDPDSRSPEEDGRRIVRLSDTRSWGWQIVNYLHYRAIRDEEDRRKYQREWAREARAKKRAAADNVDTTSTSVDTGRHESIKSTTVDPSRSRSRSRKTLEPSSTASTLWFDRFWSAWPRSDRKIAKEECRKKWVAKNLEVSGEQIVLHVEAMKETKQWLDGFEPAPLTYINQGRFNDPVPPPAGENEDDMDAKMRRALGMGR